MFIAFSLRKFSRFPLGLFGSVLGCILGALGVPLGAFGAPVGPFGRPWEYFGVTFVCFRYIGPSFRISSSLRVPCYLSGSLWVHFGQLFMGLAGDGKRNEMEMDVS